MSRSVRSIVGALTKVANFPSSTRAGLIRLTRSEETLFQDPFHEAAEWPQTACSTTRLYMPSSFASGYQVRQFSIQTQTTPNPSSLMFMPGQAVTKGGTHEFPHSRSGDSSPLAQRLFNIHGVGSLFFGPDFITVTKQEDADVSWAQLKADVSEAIKAHFESGEPMFFDSSSSSAAADEPADEDDDIVAMIKELLETRIRPAVNEDGGDIDFRHWDPDSGIVTVKMMGACSGCPSSAVTLKSGIENMLKHYIPEVLGVIEADPDEFEKDGEEELKKLEAKLNDKND